ncbi:MAG: sulfur reduction protein DsrS [Gammaproteobacteria bacterium]|nr:MAG: sulfur reduction protein DsrS [Gammaproteobacteria bacterium]
MELSAEDALRINVLLAGQLEAVRIDESSMTLYALSDKGEARVKLNPNCRDESYLRGIREALSSHVLGSPGGYPVYLKRWTRMGQARDGILESLLLLGEPEAVVAVVNASGITNEIARRAWWALQTSENARCMLRQQAVVEGDIGPVLADFLVEFLPFEEEAHNMIDSVQLVLQQNLISDETRQKIWEKGKHKNAYYVGFLLSIPDNLPEQQSPHRVWHVAREALANLCDAGNPYALQLCHLLGAPGQSFLATLELVLRKPANQDVVVALLHAIACYFEPARFNTGKYEYMDDIRHAVDNHLAINLAVDSPLGHVLGKVPELENQLRAMLTLALLDEPVVNPIFSRTDAIGTLMRKKLKPVSDVIQQQIDILRI